MLTPERDLQRAVEHLRTEWDLSEIGQVDGETIVAIESAAAELLAEVDRLRAEVAEADAQSARLRESLQQYVEAGMPEGAAAEREACARVVEQCCIGTIPGWAITRLAAAIRARGEVPDR